MEENMNTVDVNLPESAADDAQQASESSADLVQAITDAGAQEQTQNAQSANGKSEPGWIRQRVDKAVAKAVAEAEARVKAQYEQQLAPLRNQMMEQEAAKLVSDGEFKSKERALEYVKLKNGMSIEPAAQTSAPVQENASPARDAQGRFTKNESGSQADAVVQARASLLAQQAQRIKSNSGVDVMQAFNGDKNIQNRVLSGEWDFHDVADYLSGRGNVPTPIRSAGGDTGNYGVSITNMTDAQFRKLQENLASGHRYDMRK